MTTTDMKRLETWSGSIAYLELENFKSYRGVVRLGPLKSFTAVIGPNGAGKSNLMDAISFVLGVRTEQLRGKLKELLHHDRHGGMVCTQGYVEIIFQDNVHRIQLRRSILPSHGSYTSTYSINGKVTTLELYLKELATVGVLVRARNFLVFQGDIESVVSMGSTELTRMVEVVSGSYAFAKEYARLLEAKEQAEQEMMKMYGKKRNLLTEKKQKKEQMEEAKKYQDMEHALYQARLQYFAWRVYVLEREMKSMHETHQKLQEQLVSEAQRRIVSQKAIQTKKDEFTKLTSLCMDLEHRFRIHHHQLDRQDPDLIRMAEEQQRLETHQALTQSRLAEKEQRLETWKQHVRKLETDLKALESAQQKFEEVIMEEELEGVHLSEKDLQHYHRIKNHIITITGRLQQEKNALDVSYTTSLEALERQQLRCDQLNLQVHQLQQSVHGLSTKRAKMRSEREQIEHQAVDLEQKKKQLAKKMKQGASERANLTSQIEVLEKELSDGKARKRESRRDTKIIEAIAGMKSVFSGVYGRITDLGRIRQPKYHLAMAVALGPDLDSILVDSRATAKQCIQFLKDHKYFPLSFLPLDGLYSKPVQEKLRKVGGSAKLTLDLIDFDPRYLDGFLIVCGNSIICDTVEEAKHLAYTKKLGVKIVSVDGTMIQKTGTITGGLSENVESKADRWDDQKLSKLREEKIRFEKQMKMIPAPREWQMEEIRLNSEINQSTTRQKSVEMEMESTQQALEEKQSQITRAEKELVKIVEQKDHLQLDLEEKGRALDRVKHQIDEIADREFREFSSQLGVVSYREYEEQHLKKAKEMEKRRKEFEVQIRHLKAQMEYETSRDLQRPAQELKDRLREETKKLKSVKKESEKRTTEHMKAKGEIEVKQKEYEEMKSSLERMEIELKELKSVDDHNLHTMHEIETSIAASKAKESHFCDQKSDVFQSMSLEMGGDVVPDFGLLSDEMIEESVLENVLEKGRVEEELRSRIEECQLSLMHSAPNLKASEQYHLLKEQENEESQNFDRARKEEQKIAQNFQQTHNQRYQSFMEAFNHISEKIDEIYKDLTRSDLYPYGGSAALYLESEESPFLSGIKLTAIPPAKRYRDMEQLSGGEKTVVALALLFAFHSYKPCPFFILDEIDASLDAVNVDRVGDYIKQRTRDTSQAFQTIVISLKDAFFHKADCLIGVTRDVSHGGSELLTLDLEAMVENNPAN